YAEMRRDSPSVRQIVGRPISAIVRRIDGETANVRRGFASECGDRARIQPPRQKRADRYVRDELTMNGLSQVAPNLIDGRLLVEIGSDATERRKLIPLPPPRDSAVTHDHRLARSQFLDCSQRRTRSRRPQKAEIAVQGRVIQVAVQREQLEKRLDLTRERKAPR